LVRVSAKGIVSLATRAGPWQPSRHDDFIKPVSRFRLLREAIEHAVWLYHCFSVSL